MEAAILAIVLVVAVAAVAWRVWRPSPDEAVPAPGTDLVPIDPEPLPVIATERAPGGELVLSVDQRLLATLFIEADVDQLIEVMPANVSVSAAVVEMARAVPGLADALRASGFRMTFSKETLRGLTDGSMRLMGGGHAVAVDSATARFVELGKVSGTGASRIAASWPVLLSGGLAVAAAAVQQQQLNSAVAALDAGIDQLYQRHIDNDVGALQAAADLAVDVVTSSQDGPIPEQVARELAVARRDVDSIYCARRERIRRFVAEVEHAQNEHEARTGAPTAWSKDVEDAFGDPAQFHADALSFVRAAAIKAHLAAGTAAVIATEGRAAYAFEMLERNEEVLRTDILDLRRRLQALADHPPEGLWVRSGRQKAHEISTRLVAELEQRITPLLSLEEPDTITLQLDPAPILELMPGRQDPPPDVRPESDSTPEPVSRSTRRSAT